MLDSSAALDQDRLALAVLLARRDVAHLLSKNAEDSLASFTVKQGRKPEFEHHLPSPKSGTHAATSTVNETLLVRPFHHGQKQPVQVVQKRIVAVRPNITELPIRGDSPPTRETNARSKPLHAPTEKQLKNAKESHLRQLQAKIARYSAALADFRLSSEDARFHTKTSTPAKSEQNEIYEKQTRSTNRPITSSKSRKPSSILRSRSVPLKPWSSTYSQSRSQPVSKKSKSGSRIGRTNPTRIVPPKCPITKQNADALWAKTIELLQHANNEIVILKPDKKPQPHFMYPLPIKPARKLCSTSIPASEPDANPSVDCNALTFVSQSVPPKGSNRPLNDNSSVQPSPQTDEYCTRLLRKLDEVVAEEEIIRRRWFPDNRHNESGHPSANSHERHLSKSKCVDTSSAHKGSVSTMDNFPSKFKSTTKRTAQPIIFSKAKPSSSITKSNNLHLPSVSPPSKLILRLPNQLHRDLLLDSAERKLRLDQWRQRNQLLTGASDDEGGRSLVAVCEELADQLITKLIDNLADNMEREASSLVDHIVEAELYTDPPDSLSSWCESDPTVSRDLQLSSSPLPHRLHEVLEKPKIASSNQYRQTEIAQLRSCSTVIQSLREQGDIHHAQPTLSHHISTVNEANSVHNAFSTNLFSSTPKQQINIVEDTSVHQTETPVPSLKAINSSNFERTASLGDASTNHIHSPFEFEPTNREPVMEEIKSLTRASRNYDDDTLEYVENEDEKSDSDYSLDFEQHSSTRYDKRPDSNLVEKDQDYSSKFESASSTSKHSPHENLCEDDRDPSSFDLQPVSGQHLSEQGSDASSSAATLLAQLAVEGFESDVSLSQ